MRLQLWASRQIFRRLSQECPSQEFLSISHREHFARIRCLGSNLRGSRRVSSYISQTALSARPSPDPESAGLSKALHKLLSSSAGQYVNHGLVSLALHGLNNHDAPVRLSVLMAGDLETPLPILEALLKDSRSSVEYLGQVIDEAWGQGAQHIFIKQGSSTEIETQGYVSTIYFDSQTLRSQNLELLLSRADVSRIVNNGNRGLTDTLLNQHLDIKASSNGRSSNIVFPSHAVVVFGRGLSGSFDLGRLSVKAHLFPNKTAFKMVLDAPKLPSPLVSVNRISIIDSNRDFKSYSSPPEPMDTIHTGHSSEQSNVESLHHWLESITDAVPEKPKLAVQNLICAILDDVERSIMDEQMSNESEVLDKDMLQSQVQLRELTDEWAARAHNELQKEMGQSFSSTLWRRISWWKLLWRVDDVTAVATELLHRNWLHNAEKEVIFIAGQVKQASMLQSAGLKNDFTVHTSSDLARDTGNLNPSQILTSRSWPFQLDLSRQKIIENANPILQKKAQDLLVQNLSIATASTILSCLLFASLSTVTVFEVGALAALGTTYALRRLQMRWKEAEKLWLDGVMEDGRKALQSVELLLDGLIDRGSQSVEKQIRIEDARKAREALSDARRELSKFTQDDHTAISSVKDMSGSTIHTDEIGQ